MSNDMKLLIMEAVKTLLIEKKKKRITVKDICEECHITRQSFYYHFSGVPELLKWAVDRQSEKIINEFGIELSPEERIKCWILIYLNARRGIIKGEKSNYGEEIKQILEKKIIHIFQEKASESETQTDEIDKNMICRYHCYAMIGLLNNWTDDDTNNIDRIAHNVYLQLKDLL